MRNTFTLVYVIAYLTPIKRPSWYVTRLDKLPGAGIDGDNGSLQDQERCDHHNPTNTVSLACLVVYENSYKHFLFTYIIKGALSLCSLARTPVGVQFINLAALSIKLACVAVFKSLFTYFN